MNISIRKQLTVIFIGLMTAMFLANFLINTFFLEDFYYMRKQGVLIEAYQELNEKVNDRGSMSDDDLKEYGEFCNQNGLLFVVADENYRPKLQTDTPYSGLALARLNGYGIGIDSGSVIQQTDDYVIQQRYDAENGVEYLEMWGTLEKGFYFIMRINADSIRDSVQISNEFLKYIVILGIFFTGLIVWFVSRRVTKPLNELTELSKRMADLDFGVKYTGGGKNEIGQLGEHFNQMSDNLEKAYSQLLTANNELQKDIEKKEKIDDMRKEFLSNVSHELKTPIALIQGYAEGLVECINDDAESRDFYCEVIMDEASKMNVMVQKLLTLNQLEFGNEQIVMERFDIAALIRNKIQSVSILTQQKEAQIAYFGEDAVPVWGDEFKVEEVLTNYMSNALNHVSGDKRIEITVKEVDARIRVSVFNTGEQIPEEDIGQVWDKFYKVDKARTREYGGSGVGLSIVKAIMESFHQEYGVRNLENGVEFWFELNNGNGPQQEGKTGEDE